jgi:hypothetical protein
MFIVKKIFFIDIIILLINIYLLFFFKSNFLYKNIDHFFIALNTKSIDQISDYLNKKYMKSYNLENNSSIKKNI